MGITSSIQSTVDEVVKASQLQQMRQMKNQRDTQLAISIASTRDLVYFIGAAAGTIATIGILKKPFPVPAAPAVIVTTILSYQIDMGWGNKLNRIKADADLILKDERYWFNEPLQFPNRLMFPIYRKMMDNQNKKLKEMGLDPLPEWAK
ncbi:hypothetical protein BC833DRAFT_597218 [Globomyces pollinis-pini]|nr:hypothetical protein BC833DRAFT_597218 [Globomyces pollinis-pini]